MIHQALIDVVKSQLGGGVSEVEVKEFLRRRGTDESEIAEIFELISPNAPTIKDIPVSSLPTLESTTPSVPVAGQQTPVVAPEPASVRTEAHGIVRDIPPLQPSAPFNGPVEPHQLVVPADMVQSIPSLGGEPVTPINKKKTIGIVAASIVGAVAVLFGGWFVYATFLVSPDKDIDRMFSNVRGIRSVAFSGEIVIHTEIASREASATQSIVPLPSIEGPVTMTTTVSGSIDMLDEIDPRAAATLSVALDKWPMGDFKLGAEYRNLKQTSYFNISDVPDLGFFSLSFLKNKWFMIEDTQAKEQFLDGADDSGTLLSSIEQEQRNAAFTAWREHRFIAVAENLGSEDINGVSTRHYALALDKDTLVRWATRMAELLGNSTSDVEAQELSDSLESIMIEDMQIWIGKRDGLPHKAVVRMSMQDPADATKQSSTSITITGDRFNEPMNIVAPEGAASVEEVLQGIFGQMLGDATVSAPKTAQERNAKRTADVRAIMDAIAENRENNNGAFSCDAGPFPTKAAFLGTNGYDIESCLAPWYLRALPKDPSKGTAATSGYSAFYDPKTNKTTVRAPYAELGAKITITE